MTKIWARIIKNNKISAGHMATLHQEAPTVSQCLDAIRDICNELDIEYPVVLTKHKQDMVDFSLTHFLPQDFIDQVDFDRFEIEIFIEKEN